MADKCHFNNCQNISEDDCVKCGKPTCHRHGKRVGDHLVCVKCVDEAR